MEAAEFRQGIVIAQVNKLVDKAAAGRHPRRVGRLRRRVAEAVLLEPLFTRDPALITDTQVLMAMMAIKGIYGATVSEPQPRHRLQHGGHRADPAHLRRRAGAEGEDMPEWALNPHPTLIPAIESRLGGDRPLLRRRAGHGGVHARRGPTYSSSALTAPCAPTAPSARRRVTTRSTCSSAAPSRSTNSATAAPPRPTASRASAARPTWAATRRGAATLRGVAQVRRGVRLATRVHRRHAARQTPRRPDGGDLRREDDPRLRR